MNGSHAGTLRTKGRTWVALWVLLFVFSLFLQGALALTAPRAVSAESLNVDLDQWANGDPPPVGESWQNGNLNGNNSAYAEGDVVPFRLAIEGLEAGTHTIHINYDFTAGGHKAYDFLATWDATESPDECGTGGGAVSSMCPSLGAADTEPFPSDGTSANGIPVAGAEADALASEGITRLLTLYGGTIIAIAGPVHEGSPDGNSTADFMVTFSTTGSAALFLWGGHLAKSVYWDQATTGGDPDGAAQVSGAPWHMRTLNLDGGGASNQDRSIQPSAIIKTSPSISTSATASVSIGAAISDSADLAGVTADAGGTIIFKAWGPDSTPSTPTCDGTPVFTSSAFTVTGPGTYGPASFTPTTVGTYFWIAYYSGDANNNAVAGTCGDTGETSVVNPRTTTITTQVKNDADDSNVADGASVAIGTTVYDTAIISGETATAGGTVTYKLWANDSCTGDPIFTSGPHTVTAGAVPDSGTFTFTAAGTYGWQAVYSGDANNDGSSSTCGTETVVVDANSTTISTSATGTVLIGASISDSATLSGATEDAGGTITFRAWGPAAAPT
ncbi:MAG TPA: hypothetical protein VFK38_00345, partial [Candidatus Limnocylindrales bacterium]|nr:hypothetical protein [Candidatus Limnocylindrales bacterium]